MGRGATALLGAVAGVAVGGALLVLTHPTAAYTNDAYREGASAGYVMRYVVLGLVAALLLRALSIGRDRRQWLAGAGLAAVLAVMILPPLLDEETRSEKRRAAAVRSDDRETADFVAGAVEGCVDNTREELEGTPQEKDLDADTYCECFMREVTRGPENDRLEIMAASRAIDGNRPGRKLRRIAERCTEQALA